MVGRLLVLQTRGNLPPRYQEVLREGRLETGNLETKTHSSSCSLSSSFSPIPSPLLSSPLLFFSSPLPLLSSPLPPLPFSPLLFLLSPPPFSPYRRYSRVTSMAWRSSQTCMESVISCSSETTPNTNLRYKTSILSCTSIISACILQ